MDLEKAFNHAPHDTLWEVLQEYGVQGPQLSKILDSGTATRCYLFIFINRISRDSWGPEGIQFQHQSTYLIVAFCRWRCPFVLFYLGHLACTGVVCSSASVEIAWTRISTSKSKAMVFKWKREACHLWIKGEVIKYLGFAHKWGKCGTWDWQIDRCNGCSNVVNVPVFHRWSSIFSGFLIGEVFYANLTGRRPQGWPGNALGSYQRSRLEEVSG